MLFIQNFLNSFVHNLSFPQEVLGCTLTSFYRLGVQTVCLLKIVQTISSALFYYLSKFSIAFIR